MFGTTGVDGRTFSVKDTFNASPKITWTVVKVAVMALNIFSVINSIYMERPDRSFWVWHLTHWTTTVSTAYLIASFISFVVPIDSDTTELRSYLKAAWGLFVVSANLQLFVFILFWILVYESGSEIQYKTIYEHGALFFIVVFDGFLIHRFSVRFKQIALVYCVQLPYLAFTGIHAVSGVGNPTTSDNDPETDDDAVYSSLNWNQRPQGSAILATFLIFVLVPILYLLIWSVSIFIPRKYSNFDLDPETDKVMIEQGVEDSKEESA